MTYIDGIGKRNSLPGGYDSLTDPKVIRIFLIDERSMVGVESPEGRFVLRCPVCTDSFPNLNFHSVDKVSADMLITCLSCRTIYEVGDVSLDPVR